MDKSIKGRAAYGLETTQGRGGKKRRINRDWTGGGDTDRAAH